jgi:hypothetical protein
MLRHREIPLDFVVDGDELKNYEHLILADVNVSLAGSRAIADWVKAGGHLTVTAGGGMFDEFNRPNKVLRDLLGVEQTKLEEATGEPIRFEKQDLPFAKQLATYRVAIPIFGVRSHVKIGKNFVAEKFNDDKPASMMNAGNTGKGSAWYFAYLPGLTYFKSAMPLRPMDRGATDKSMTHFLPTNFNGQFGLDLKRPVECEDPRGGGTTLVETTVIEAPQGVVIPLINWKGKDGVGVPIKNLRVAVNIPVPKNVSLASGRPVRMGMYGNARLFTLDLDVADALILRK